MVSKKLTALKKVLFELKEEYGYFTPQMIVDKARPDDSPIHYLFDWVDEHAAEQYRLWQAREYTKDVTVEIVGRETQAYFNIITYIEDVKTQGYYDIGTVLSEDRLRKQVIKDALAKLSYWQRQYQEFSELANLVDNDLLKELADKLKE